MRERHSHGLRVKERDNDAHADHARRQEAARREKNERSLRVQRAIDPRPFQPRAAAQPAAPPPSLKMLVRRDPDAAARELLWQRLSQDAPQ